MIRRFDDISAIAGTLIMGPLLGISVAMNAAKAYEAVNAEGGAMVISDPDLMRNYIITGAVIGFIPAVIIAVIFSKIYKKTPAGKKRMRLLFIMFFLIMSMIFTAALFMTELGKY